MKHSDFFAAHKAIDDIAKMELVAALKARGSKFVAIGPNAKGDEAILVGYFKFSDGPENILFTKAILTDNDQLVIYGKPYHDLFQEEAKIDNLEFGYIQYILDIMPES